MFEPYRALRENVKSITIYVTVAGTSRARRKTWLAPWSPGKIKMWVTSLGSMQSRKITIRLKDGTIKKWGVPNSDLMALDRLFEEDPK